MLQVNSIYELMGKFNNEYKSLLDVIDNVIVVIDENYNLLYKNKAFDKYLNNYFIKEICAKIKKWNFLNENKLEIFENYNDKTIKITVLKISNYHGKLEGYFLVANNIDELSKDKNKLAIDKEIYQIAFKQANTYLWEYDIKERSIKALFCPDDAVLRILDHNRIYYNIPESLVTMDIISSEDSKRVEKMCQEMVEGKPHNQIELKMRNYDGGFQWVRLNCTTIFDQQNQPVKAIAAVENINKYVELKTKYQIEREYREVLGKDSLYYIEVDLYNNRILKQHVGIDNFITVTNGKDYSDFVYSLANNVNENDYERIIKELSIVYLLKEYQNGEHYLKFEYRFYNQKTKKYHFAKVSIFLICINDQLYACEYIKDINENKVKDLVMQKKIELDPLTGLYNRKAIEFKINQLIEKAPDSKHAIMILDIDNFKAINDNFGHLYGDALLCEISRKLKSLFRIDDLIARLGGDEYLILMKNIPNVHIVIEKAKSICQSLNKVYGASDIKINISVSIGIALYPEHGHNFKELYFHSDQALYKVKNENKNDIYLYTDSMLNYNRNVNNKKRLIRQTGNAIIKNLEDYIFRILYSSQDLQKTINAILELLEMHYNLKQSLIITKDLIDGKYKIISTLKYEEKIRNNLIELLSSNKLNEYGELFNQNGILWIDNVENLNDNNVLKKIYKDTEIKSVIQCLIKSENDIIGIISLEYHELYQFTNEEKENLITAIAIINTFIVKKYQEQEKNLYSQIMQNILDFQENGIYIINPNTFRLIYVNNRIRKMYKNIKIGDYCYRTFLSKEQQCENCPLKEMNKNQETYNKLIYNDAIGAKLQLYIRRIKWINGCDAVSITSINIDKKIDS